MTVCFLWRGIAKKAKKRESKKTKSREQKIKASEVFEDFGGNFSIGFLNFLAEVFSATLLREPQLL
jgi:hypothetical protein